MPEQYVDFGRVCSKRSLEDQTKSMSCCLNPTLLEEEGITEKKSMKYANAKNFFPRTKHFKY